MGKLLCYLFGHKWVILWCQVEGRRCRRCGETIITRVKPESEWARLPERVTNYA